MTGFEYKVVPAPMRGLKAKGVKGTPARFANALETVMNDLGAEGWEYQRTDTLPVEERQGLTGKTTSFQNMLVFRRALEAEAPDVAEVTALIEDQSVVVPAAAPMIEDEAPAQEAEGQAQEAEPADEDIASEPLEPNEAADTLRLAAEKRVNDTIAAPFSFPWSKRASKSAPSTTRDDDTNIPAE